MAECNENKKAKLNFSSKSVTTTKIRVTESLLDKLLKNKHITVDIIYYFCSLLYLGFLRVSSFQTCFFTVLILEGAKTLWRQKNLPPFSLIRDFGKQNTRGNVSKISVSLACYRQIGSKSTNHSH